MFTRQQETEEGTDFGRPRRTRWRRWVVLGAVAVLVAAGLTKFGMVWFTTCGPLGSGVRVIHGECVGVTDGSYVFSPELAAVEGRIKAENDRVATSGRRTVTIGLLDMYTANATSPLSINQEREELEGAYTAQLRANDTPDFRDPQPKIRLVLANEGSHEQEWQSATHQLEDMIDDDPPLVAVAGLGVSIQPTLDGANDLAQHQIPMVGGVITTDVIDTPGIAGFARVQPSDQQFVNSLTGYLHRDPALRRGLISYDINSGTENKPGQDLYAWSLRKDMEKVPLAHSFAPLGYVGRSGPGPVDSDLFSNTVSNICGVKPDVVFYAGRLIDLPSFLAALERRECVAQPLTVATGGTDLGSLNNPRTIAQLRAARLTVVYASATDGRDWAAHPGQAPDHFAGFLAGFTSRAKEPVGDIDDGYALALHDAVATAVMATRLAYTAGSPTGGATLTHNSVLQQLYNLVNSDYVPGAAGDITFPSENNGDPSHKPLPVLTIPPAEDTQVPSAACPPPDQDALYCTP